MRCSIVAMQSAPLRPYGPRSPSRPSPNNPAVTRCASGGGQLIDDRGAAPGSLPRQQISSAARPRQARRSETTEDAALRHQERHVSIERHRLDQLGLFRREDHRLAWHQPLRPSGITVACRAMSAARETAIRRPPAVAPLAWQACWNCVGILNVRNDCLEPVAPRAHAAARVAPGPGSMRCRKKSAQRHRLLQQGACRLDTTRRARSVSGSNPCGQKGAQAPDARLGADAEGTARPHPARPGRHRRRPRLPAQSAAARRSCAGPSAVPRLATA